MNLTNEGIDKLMESWTKSLNEEQLELFPADKRCPIENILPVCECGHKNKSIPLRSHSDWCGYRIYKEKK